MTGEPEQRGSSPPSSVVPQQPGAAGRSGSAAQQRVGVIGGGPAGLAVATLLARRGVPTVLFERQSLPVDKACGEGLMPSGLRVLEALGARARIPAEEQSPFLALRFIEEDGRVTEAPLPDGGGVGIRRTALSSALLSCARDEGVDLRAGQAVRRIVRQSAGFELHTDEGREPVAFLIAADGLHSPTRQALGLDRPASPSGRALRFGLRQHVEATVAAAVEVHLSAGAEAYVTPAGRGRAGLAVLFDKHARPREGTAQSLGALLSRFPHLQLAARPSLSEPRGAGPLFREVLAPVTDRAALLGDAGGYVDAITGEGLSVALLSAEALAETLPEALLRGATTSSLLPYRRAHRRLFRHYAFSARMLLALSPRVRLRRTVLTFLRRHPLLLRAVIAHSVRLG